MEIVNIGAVSFPAAVDQAIRSGLASQEDFDSVLAQTEKNIEDQVVQLTKAYENLMLPPAPYYSVFMRGSIEEGRDISCGSKYNNFGIHGACVANAADALAAVKQFVFDEGSVKGEEVVLALENNFKGYESVRRIMAEVGPKVGSNESAPDAYLVKLFDFFADACEKYGKTSKGGILRPGTGSAMYYIWLASGHAGMREPVVGATADGRFAGEPFSANLAPSPRAKVAGPISSLQSFSKIDYQRICNGGPITMELSDTVFRDDDSVRKVALLVRVFAQLGCQQLQLNSLSLETLLDARVNPERHKNLIVRVWGWSGYFCELAPEYQDHIIARHLYRET
jgi:formate C-acetyltransferase